MGHYSVRWSLCGVMAGHQQWLHTVFTVLVFSVRVTGFKQAFLRVEAERVSVCPVSVEPAPGSVAVTLQQMALTCLKFIR